MHLFRLLFHFPFCHESLLKRLFDWNRPCCSHTLLLTALHPAITPRSLSLSFFFLLCSRAGALFGIPRPLLSYHLPAFFFSPSTSNEGRRPPPPPSFPHLLSPLVFVCFMSAVAGESWGVLYWEIQLSLPALILDNRKRARYSQFNYWQCWMQRCMCMSVLRRVSTCRPKQARKCTLDLFNYAFSFKACIFRLMIVLLSCSGCCLSFSLSPFFSAGTSVSRRPSSSL